MMRTILSVLTCLAAAFLFYTTHHGARKVLPKVVVAVPNVIRPYAFKATGPGALCSTWRKCTHGLKCSHWHSVPGFNVGTCLRVVPPGYPCDDGAYTCGAPAKCLSGIGGKKCRLELQAGGHCRDYRRTQCAAGHSCVHGYCFKAVTYGGKCNNKYLRCRKRLTCDAGRCKILSPKGQRCGPSFVACAPGTRCLPYGTQGKLCVTALPYGGLCGANFNMCYDGLVCTGGGSAAGPKRCVTPVPKGDVCDNAYRACQSGLYCLKYGYHRRCVAMMGRDGDCSGRYMLCKKPLTCIRDGASHKCSTFVKAYKGQYCGKHVYCARGLTCIGSGQAARCYSIQAVGGLCDGQYAVCAKGLLCRGYADGNGPKKCVHPIRIGHPCDGGYLACEPHLQCVPHGYGKKCVSLLKEHDDCTGDFHMCAKGLECAGSKDKRMCRTPPQKALAYGGKGKPCGTEYSKCEAGLQCIGKDLFARCYGVMKYGGVCDGPFMKCEGALHCRAPGLGDGPKKCVKPILKGEKCDHYYHLCHAGLDCFKYDDASRCVSVGLVNADCSRPYTICAPGLTCAVRSGRKICYDPYAPKTPAVAAPKAPASPPGSSVSSSVLNSLPKSIADSVLGAKKPAITAPKAPPASPPKPADNAPPASPPKPADKAPPASPPKNSASTPQSPPQSTGGSTDALVNKVADEIKGAPRDIFSDVPLDKQKLAQVILSGELGPVSGSSTSATTPSGKAPPSLPKSPPASKPGAPAGATQPSSGGVSDAVVNKVADEIKGAPTHIFGDIPLGDKEKLKHAILSVQVQNFTK